MGTISEKLTYLNTTKTNLKDMINYGLPSEEQITSSTTFRNYVSSIFEAFLESLRDSETLYTNLPKKSGNGTQITLNDTAYSPMRITLGSSALEQTTYTGKNLMNNVSLTNLNIEGTWNNGVYTMNGVSFTPIYIGNLLQYINVNGTATGGNATFFLGRGKMIANKKMWLSGCPSGGSDTTYFLHMDYFGNDIGSGKYTTQTSDISNINCYIRVMDTKQASNLKFYPMLEQNDGSTATAYEPYVGGTASPNPSYPQDIHTISGNNSIVVEGKNLANFTTLTLSGDKTITNGSVDATSVTSSATSTFKFNETTLSSGNYCFYFKTSRTGETNSNQVLADASNTQLGTFHFLMAGTSYCDFTLESPTTISSFKMWFPGTYGGVISEISLIKGTHDNISTYVPYQSNTQTIDLTPYNLGSIGNYENRIFKNVSGDTDYSSEREEGGWYYKEGIGKVVLDENSDINYYQADGLTNNYRFRYVIDTLDPITTTTSPFKCNIYGASDILYNYVNDTQSTYLAGGIWYIKISKALIDSYTGSTMQEKFPNYLAQNNIVLYAKKVNTTYTQITGELAQELEQVYKGMLSYDGTTNISQVNNDLPFTLSVSALEDLS